MTQKKTWGRLRAGQGALIILALLLASSGAMRIGLSVGQVWANTGQAVAESSEPLTCPLPPLAVAEALLVREDQLASRESAVDERFAALTLAEQAITAKLQTLVEAEVRLKETLALADGAAEKDLARLTEVYETMKPKGAANLFSAMAPEFAAGFLGRMRPDAAAAILAGMAPDTAYAVSLLLAGRNTAVPKE